MGSTTSSTPAAVVQAATDQMTNPEVEQALHTKDAALVTLVTVLIQAKLTRRPVKLSFLARKLAHVQDETNVHSVLKYMRDNGMPARACQLLQDLIRNKTNKVKVQSIVDNARTVLNAADLQSMLRGVFGRAVARAL